VKQQQFESLHQRAWEAFEAQLGQQDLGMRPSKALDLQDFPDRYRQICHHLAVAQQRAYTPTLVQHLHDLALRGHQALYGQRSGLAGRWAAFLVHGFPRLVRASWRSVLLAALLFGAPFAGLPFLIQQDPEVAFLIEPPQDLARYEGMYQPKGERFGRERAGDTDVAMFGHYIWNNIRITFQAFATGLLGGVGSVFFLLWNGLHGGAVAGHLTRIGLGSTFWPFVATHSALELPALVLAGAAGLQVGGALLAPGRRRRLDALRETTAACAPLVYGAAAMDVGAALIEAFWSASAQIPPAVKFTVGGGLWGMVLLYFALGGLRGRRRA